jgi:hypothetical protein
MPDESAHEWHYYSRDPQSYALAQSRAGRRVELAYRATAHNHRYGQECRSGCRLGQRTEVTYHVAGREVE